jgi:bifunctional non-homologous end joining protein LigD
MTIKKYNTKRDFNKTLEPLGKKEKSVKSSSPIFVIQKHAASHLHYDFRLEINGVLKSWAIPKGPCLDPQVKRLAVQVEDHPLPYGSFEGIIPKGQYGGGTVMLWDKGTWEEIKEPKKGVHKGNLSFILKGKKLKGKWELIQIKSDPKNWLLIKSNDNQAKALSEYDVTAEKPLSVISKKSMDEIKGHSNKIWHSDKKNTTNPTDISKKPSSKKKEIIYIEKLKVDLQLKKSPLPKEIFPQLATLVDKAPETDNWIHEIKFDGYRLIAHIEKKVKLLTRGQKDWTDKFLSIEQALKILNLKNSILDGEVVVLDKKGHSNFQLLQNALSEEDSKVEMVYYVFDLLYYQGYDLTDLDLLKRKELLKKILSNHSSDNIRFSDHVVGNGEALFKKACKLSLEGIISKEIHSMYNQKRSKDWLKIKCSNRQEFIVGGFTQPQNSREYFGSLLLGVYKNQKLIYCGHVGTGFDSATLKQLHAILIKNKTHTMPFESVPLTSNVASWVKPNIVIEVEFTEWTQEGILRHPSFKGIRQDKPADKIKREDKKKVKENTSSAVSKKELINKKEKQKKQESQEKFELTHPEKVMFPEAKITKLEMAKFYHAISQWVLPYIINRPLSLVRCPDGREGKCFFQKHLNTHENTDAVLFEAKPNNKDEKFMYIKNIKGLLKLVQMGVLEIHPWGARVDKPEKPDFIIFDLDPAPDVPWKKVIEAAFRVKEELEKIGLKSFVKTTGGKGLHVTLPFQRRYSWEQVNHFSKIFAEFMAGKYPKEYISVMSKRKRGGKIFIDYLRNHQGATAIAPYSIRARENAPIATPLHWDELTIKIKSTQFTLKTLPKRLTQLENDPWEDFFKIKQKLPIKPNM